MFAKPGASRTLVAGVVIVVLVAAALGAFIASGGMSSKSTSTSAETATIAPSPSLTASTVTTSSSTSASSALPSLAIGEFYADVAGPNSGYYNQLNDNDTELTGSGSGGTVYLGTAGDSFVLQVTLIYTDCQSDCPSQVVSVSALQSGFTISSTSPAVPIPIDNPPGTPSSIVTFQFTVTVASPSTAYNGPLTIVSTVQ